MRPISWIAVILMSTLPWLLTSSAAAATPDQPATPRALEEVYERYETVRQALAADSIDGVKVQAHALKNLSGKLQETWSPSSRREGSAPTDSSRALLQDLTTAAEALARSSTLEDARDAFYSLSKPLVRLRSSLPEETRPVVAFCSMAKRSWLQPEGQLTNPYYGESMLRCGEIIED